MTEADAMETARRAAQGTPVDRILDLLGRRVGERVGTEAVFGTPITRDGLTVVPVARVRWGFGGGGGWTEDGGPSARGGPGDANPRPATGSGSGGGGGLAADPVGYLEIDAQGAEFRPIGQLPSPVFILACGITAAIVLRAIARLAGR
jgi:uncharacterized spore protein YtfJ